MTGRISSTLREKWYGALVAIPNDTFLTRITAVLGKIKTPYNKQHLLEQLESHLSRAEVQSDIVSRLTDVDKAILSAVILSREPSAALILELTDELFSSAVVTEHVRALTDGFVLYGSLIGGVCIYSAAPPLLDVIRPFVSYRTFISLGGDRENTYSPAFEDTPEPVSELEMAALISFILPHKRARKVGGHFTVPAARDAADKFQSRSKRQEVLLGAMVNLSLVKDADALSVNWPLMSSFASLAVAHREALLCAAAAVNTKNAATAQRLAQTLLDCQATAGDRVITKQTLHAMATVLFEADASSVPSRFDTLLSKRASVPSTRESAASRQANRSEATYQDMMELFVTVIDAACDFGYVQKEGNFYRFRFTKPSRQAKRSVPVIASDSEAISYCRGHSPEVRDCFRGSQDSTIAMTDMSTPPLVTIDASFTVTVMPGVSLSQMLDMVPFLSLASCQTACVFSVTHESASHAFDLGFTVESIISTLEKYTGQKPTDSLTVSLESWYESYAAVHLYRGYVLQLTESAARRLECSPDYAKYVHQKIADGVYLLNVQTMPLAESNNEAAKILSRFGFKYIDKVEAVPSDAEKRLAQKRLALPSLSEGKSIFDREGNN